MALKMGTIPLQRGIIYGPVVSRRLGRSLGINLLPDEIKVCSMNCRYCQYSWTGMLTADGKEPEAFLPSRKEVADAVESVFRELAGAGTPPDTVTFSGNGEATLHPEFPAVVEDLMELKESFFPKCRSAALSNSTTLGNQMVLDALLRLDDAIMKLDAGNEAMFRKLNGPAPGIRFGDVVAGLRRMGSKAVLQSMFVAGSVNNCSDEEVDAWLDIVSSIAPRGVQVFTLDRGPADSGLLPASFEMLESIVERLKRNGIDGEAFM